MKNRNPNLGKYILDSLSIGMYNRPFLVIREYIQNCTDAIDELEQKSNFKTPKSKIDIQIDARTKSLNIIDNGIGVPANQAWNILHDIGKSTKELENNRGFRGIGRLGGLCYCKELRFLTKARGEDIYSMSIWDCEKLRKLIKDNNELSTSDIIKEITKFKQDKYAHDSQDHFFTVKMLHLQSSRDFLLNVPLIKEYVSQVGPVPFNKETFKKANVIEKTLKSNVSNYKTYNIFVNGEKIYKPYKDTVILRGKHKDKIDKIQFFELKNTENRLAFGWLAELQLLGTISDIAHIDGIRVRSGNILIGDKFLLSDFFRERRFNNYLAGEIHIIDKNLIPNSRRDDFEDNETRDDFYESFIKKIGLPYSKRIRQLSLERSNNNKLRKENYLIDRAELIIERGYYSVKQKEQLIKGLCELINNNCNNSKYIKRLINNLQDSKHFVDLYKGRYSKNKTKFLKSVFDIIYSECQNKQEAEKIIGKIIAK
ncbi:MAG: ATP-binding protein [Candidatus Hodarchaeota archaeon]